MNNINSKCDVLILGGGIVGLTIAYQLLERDLTKKIFILDSEESLGKHTSGRNSGVLHAGLYYKPNSLKAKVCVSGAKRLKNWIVEKIHSNFSYSIYAYSNSRLLYTTSSE